MLLFENVPNLVKWTVQATFIGKVTVCLAHSNVVTNKTIHIMQTLGHL